MQMVNYNVHKKTELSYYIFMIHSIIELLKYSKSKSEIVQIAKGTAALFTAPQ